MRMALPLELQIRRPIRITAQCATPSKPLQLAITGYVPPSAKTLSDRKLGEEYDDAKKQIAKRDAEGELSRKFGRAYTSDGWDSCDSLPLINSAFPIHPRQ